MWITNDNDIQQVSYINIERKRKKRRRRKEKQRRIPEIMIRRLIGHVKMPPRDLMLLAILRILSRRSLDLGFLGVEDDARFLFVGVPVGLVLEDEDEGLETVVVSDFLRLGSDGEGSKKKVE